MRKAIRRGDLFYADLNPVVGSEQGGIRPVLVIQNDVGNHFSPTVVAAAITSRKAKNSLPTHILLENVPGLAPTSLLLLEQLRTIDRKRLRGYIGRISKEKMLEVDAALAISIGIVQRKISLMPVCTQEMSCLTQFVFVEQIGNLVRHFHDHICCIKRVVIPQIDLFH